MTSSETQSARSVVAITGARGIGLASAKRFGRHSAIVLADSSPEILEEATAELRALGIEAEGVVCDVSSESDVARFAQLAAQRGRISAVIHAAGLSPSMASAVRILEVNYLGTQLVVSAFEPVLPNQSVVVCFSSLAAYRRGPQRYAQMLTDPRQDGVLDALIKAAAGVPAAAYALSKLGIRLLVERKAIDLGRRGIRIISISPGAVDTPMGRLEVSKRAMGPVTDGFLAFVPLARWVEADEMAAFVQLLCDPAAGYVTGCDIKVDGGAMAYMHHKADLAVLTKFDDPWV